MPHAEQLYPVEPITAGLFHHFFGYYEKTPWNASRRSVLALRVSFLKRPPTPEDMAVIGCVDLNGEKRWRPLAATVAWCWQQSTMRQWLCSDPENTIVFNSRSASGFHTTILDVGEVTG